MTSKGSPRKPVRKRRKTPAPEWLSRLLACWLVPGAEPLLIPLPHSAVDERFYNDFRGSIDQIWGEAGATQSSGMLVMQVFEASPRGTMPAPLWDEICPKFEGLLRDLFARRSSSGEVSVEGRDGHCRIGLWFGLAPFEKVGQASEGMPLEQSIQDLLGHLPSEYGSCRDRLATLSDAFRKQLGMALQGPLNKRLAEMPHETYEDKQKLVAWLKAELRRFGLAVKCPKTGRASLLQADVGRHPSRGRFQTDNVDENGKRERPMSFNELIPLEFIPEDLSRESSDKWVERSQSRSDGPGRKSRR